MLEISICYKKTLRHIREYAEFYIKRTTMHCITALEYRKHYSMFAFPHKVFKIVLSAFKIIKLYWQTLLNQL